MYAEQMIFIPVEWQRNENYCMKKEGTLMKKKKKGKKQKQNRKVEFNVQLG